MYKDLAINSLFMSALAISIGACASLNDEDKSVLSSNRILSEEANRMALEAKEQATKAEESHKIIEKKMDMLLRQLHKK